MDKNKIKSIIKDKNKKIKFSNFLKSQLGSSIPLEKELGKKITVDFLYKVNKPTNPQTRKKYEKFFDKYKKELEKVLVDFEEETSNKSNCETNNLKLNVIDFELKEDIKEILEDPTEKNRLSKFLKKQLTKKYSISLEDELGKSIKLEFLFGIEIPVSPLTKEKYINFYEKHKEKIEEIIFRFISGEEIKPPNKILTPNDKHNINELIEDAINKKIRNKKENKIEYKYIDSKKDVLHIYASEKISDELYSYVVNFMKLKFGTLARGKTNDNRIVYMLTWEKGVPQTVKTYITEKLINAIQNDVYGIYMKTTR